MNCKEFKELADSFLCDELAVETNHRVIKHLENCVDCRRDLSARRELRDTLRSAVAGSPEFRIDPKFEASLRERFDASSRPRRLFGGWNVLVPVAAALLIVCGLFFARFYQQSLAAQAKFQAYIVDISKDAIGDHEFCAIDKLKYWENAAKPLTEEQSEFVASLTSDGTEVLTAHDCVYDGKVFRHYILRRNGRIVSVASVASDVAQSASTSSQNSIITESDETYRVASFQKGEKLVFVVSDLSETENLALARRLSNSLRA